MHPTLQTVFIDRFVSEGRSHFISLEPHLQYFSFSCGGQQVILKLDGWSSLSQHKRTSPRHQTSTSSSDQVTYVPQFVCSDLFLIYVSVVTVSREKSPHLNTPYKHHRRPPITHEGLLKDCSHFINRYEGVEVKTGRVRDPISVLWSSSDFDTVENDSKLSIHVWGRSKSEQLITATEMY